MKELITSNLFFGLALTLIAYNLALYIRKKTNLMILNPLLVSIILVVFIILVGDIEYENYKIGSSYISNLLTPTTVCLAVPLYENLTILKRDKMAIMAGIISGILSSAFTILPLTYLFSLDKVDYITLLPKSITSAIGMVLSEQFGGIVPVTVISIVITGIIGAILSDAVFKLFKITDPEAQGIALGASAHAMGTSQAFEKSALHGACSSLALAVSGILTALTFSVFVNLY